MAKKSKPAPEPEEDLEELEDDEEAKPAKGKKGADDVEFGVSDLCAYIKEKTGKDYTTREMRTLLRKMAREENKRVDREVIPGNRARYNWAGGPKNPEVKAILKAVAGGEIEESRKEALAALKERKAAKDAGEGKAGKKGKKGKKAKPAPEPEEDVDFEDLDD